MTAEFTPEVLEKASCDIDRMRANYLFGVDEAGASPEAVQHYLMALALLQQASHAMKIAQYAQSRALAGR